MLFVQFLRPFGSKRASSSACSFLFRASEIILALLKIRVIREIRVRLNIRALRAIRVRLVIRASEIILALLIIRAIRAIRVRLK